MSLSNYGPWHNIEQRSPEHDRGQSRHTQQRDLLEDTVPSDRQQAEGGTAGPYCGCPEKAKPPGAGERAVLVHTGKRQGICGVWKLLCALILEGGWQGEGGWGGHSFRHLVCMKSFKYIFKKTIGKQSHIENRQMLSLPSAARGVCGHLPSKRGVSEILNVILHRRVCEDCHQMAIRRDFDWVCRDEGWSGRGPGRGPRSPRHLCWAWTGRPWSCAPGREVWARCKGRSCAFSSQQQINWA